MSELKCFTKRLESLSQNRPLVPAIAPHAAPVTNPTPSYGGQTERLRIEAAQYRLEKIIDDLNSSPVEPSVSLEHQESLRKKAYKEAGNQFISHKVKMLSEEQFTKELENNLTQRTSVTLLAEVTRHCVPPAASSEKVWSAMRQRHQEMVKNSHQHNPLQKEQKGNNVVDAPEETAQFSSSGSIGYF